MLNPFVALPPDPPLPAVLFCPAAEALPGLPPFPAATPTNAIFVLPAGTVYVPEALNVCSNEYAGRGVIELLADEAEEVPNLFVAVIVNV